MTRTTENLLTWAPLGAGIALMMSDHKRLGLAVAAVSPVTVAWRHPRATRRALRAVPQVLEDTGKSLGKMGRTVGEASASSGEKIARGFRWLAS